MKVTGKIIALSLSSVLGACAPQAIQSEGSDGLSVKQHDEATLDRRLAPILTYAERSLTAGGLLRGTPERVVMDPTPRSRLRWLAGTGAGVSP